MASDKQLAYFSDSMSGSLTMRSFNDKQAAVKTTAPADETQKRQIHERPNLRARARPPLQFPKPLRATPPRQRVRACREQEAGPNRFRPAASRVQNDWVSKTPWHTPRGFAVR